VKEKKIETVVTIPFQTNH